MTWETIRDAPPEVLDRMLGLLAEGHREQVHEDLKKALAAHG